MSYGYRDTEKHANPFDLSDDESSLGALPKYRNTGNTNSGQRISSQYPPLNTSAPSTVPGTATSRSFSFSNPYDSGHSSYSGQVNPFSDRNAYELQHVSSNLSKETSFTVNNHSVMNTSSSNTTNSPPMMGAANPNTTRNLSGTVYTNNNLPPVPNFSAFQTPGMEPTRPTDAFQPPAPPGGPINLRNASLEMRPPLDINLKQEVQGESAIKQVLFGPRENGYAYFTILVTIVQLGVFIYELIKMGLYTHNPFQTKPYFNPMLGPSTYLLTNVGARYLPCMTKIENITSVASMTWPCPNSTSYQTDVCSLSELCGMGGISEDSSGELNPNQWWRLITPIFIHAGFLHIIFNWVLQLTMGVKIERYIGSLRYGFIYMASGISGFLLGANFTPAGMTSSGASGALFGSCISINLLLLLLNNNLTHYDSRLQNASRNQFRMFLGGSIVEIIVMIVLGLLPGLDNFAHIGGFVVGLTLGIVLLNDPIFVFTREYRDYKKNMSYGATNIGSFMSLRNRISFLFWTFFRVVCLILTVLYFVLLAQNFADKGAEASESCKWCKYINCIPVNGWCEIGDLSVTTTTDDSSTDSSDSTSTATDATATSTPTNNFSGFASIIPFFAIRLIYNLIKDML